MLIGTVALTALVLGVVVLVLTTPESEAPELVNQPLPTARATESPTPEPTATPKPFIPVPQAFRDFVRQSVVPALQAGDVDFFAQRAKTEHIVCTPQNTPPQNMGGPLCKTVGQEFDGFPLGPWRSEISIVPAKEALDLIQRLITEAVPAASDQYGGAQAQVRALGVHPTWQIKDGKLATDWGVTGYVTVITALVQRPPDVLGTGPLRAALVQLWEQNGADFRLSSMISVFVLVEEVLDSPGPEGWLSWERY